MEGCGGVWRRVEGCSDARARRRETTHGRQHTTRALLNGVRARNPHPTHTNPNKNAPQKTHTTTHAPCNELYAGMFSKLG